MGVSGSAGGNLGDAAPAAGHEGRDRPDARYRARCQCPMHGVRILVPVPIPLPGVRILVPMRGAQVPVPVPGSWYRCPMPGSRCQCPDLSSQILVPISNAPGAGASVGIPILVLDLGVEAGGRRRWPLGGGRGVRGRRQDGKTGHFAGKRAAGPGCPPGQGCHGDMQRPARPGLVIDIRPPRPPEQGMRGGLAAEPLPASAPSGALGSISSEPKPRPCVSPLHSSSPFSGMSLDRAWGAAEAAVS